MDNHCSDASILNPSDCLSKDDQKRCHIDAVNGRSLNDSLVDQHKINEKDFTVSIKLFNEIADNEAGKLSKDNFFFLINSKNEKVQVKNADKHRK